jgi:tetratricopeptide (TPR) repeat protein
MSAASGWKLALEAGELHRRGRSRAALRLLERASRRLKASGWPGLLAFRIRLEAGLPSAARSVDTAFRREPGCAWIFGLAALPAGLPPEARRLLREHKAFGRRSDSAPVHAYLGQSELARGRAAGLRRLRRAVRLKEAGWICAWLGEAERQSGRADAALAQLDRAVRLDPRYANAWAWRGTVHLQAGRLDEARRDLDRALRLQPTARAFLDRSRLKRKLQDWDGALDDLESAARLSSDVSWSGPRPGGAEAALGEIEEALRRRPGEPRLLSWKGETLLRLGRPREAAAAFDDALLKRPRLAWARIWRAEAKLALGLPAREALPDLSLALRADPLLARGHAARAEALWRLGRKKPALASLEEAVRLSPYSASLRLARSRAFEAAGLPSKAWAEADRAARLCPGWAEAERDRDRLASAGR